jgi:hypothetical protein
MRNLFNLRIAPERRRADIDAFLEIDETVVNFELKSTTGNSVSTVRDFGPDHIAKWRDGLHWIFAFYREDGVTLEYCAYASPSDMEPWIAEKERYIAPDLALADLLPQYVSPDHVITTFGFKDTYVLADASRVMKKQWKRAEYLRQQDKLGGYSLDRMTELMRLRAEYVLRRGSTLNNPHIEKEFFTGLQRITTEHAATLRELVRDYLSASPIDAATA